MFLAFVLAPLARKEFPPEQRLRIVSAVGRRFNTLSWAALAVLITTGIYSAYWRLGGFEPLFGSAYGRLLLIKVAIVIVVMALTWFHSYRLGPRLEALAADPAATEEEKTTARGRLIRLSSVHLLLNLAVLFIAALLSLS